MMNRLTKKQGNLYYPTNESYLTPDDGSNAARLLQVIGSYEDLQEAFGIDFPTLYMALKDGIYTKQYGHLFVEHFVLKCDKELHCRPTYCAEIRFALKDYKKTWALCREELEDD